MKCSAICVHYASATEKRTNEFVKQKIGDDWSLMNNIDLRKLRYFGHIARNNSLENDILTGMVPGKRTRGRPQMKYFDSITQITGIKSMNKLLTKAKKRAEMETVHMGSHS